MLPRGEILAWRADQAPWADEDDVEQDLLLTRALCDVFTDGFLREHLAFRGGTALHKLHLPPAARYSDDLDFVQREAEPIGPTLDRLRAVLGWLGRGRSEIGEHPKLTFAFITEATGQGRRIKIEINTHEHFGSAIARPFSVRSSRKEPKHGRTSQSPLIGSLQRSRRSGPHGAEGRPLRLTRRDPD